MKIGIGFVPQNYPDWARYDAGTWGPREAARLLDRDGRRWRRL